MFKFVRFSSVPIAIISGHSAFVCSERRRVVKRADYTTQNTFKIGDADDAIMDNLKTGDVLLFSRDPFKHHFPVAMYILLFKAIHKTEFDHAACIVMNTKGLPMVVEATFSGVKFRPYDERIMHSKSKQIALVPIEESSIVKTVESDMSFIEHMKSSTSENLYSSYKGLIASVLNKIIFNEDKLTIPYSPSTYLTGKFVLYKHRQSINRSKNSSISTTNDLGHLFMKEIIKKKYEARRYSSSDVTLEDKSDEPSYDILPSSFLPTESAKSCSSEGSLFVPYKSDIVYIRV